LEGLVGLRELGDLEGLVWLGLFFWVNPPSHDGVPAFLGELGLRPKVNALGLAGRLSWIIRVVSRVSSRSTWKGEGGRQERGW
jgi:hypothetical protein